MHTKNKHFFWEWLLLKNKIKSYYGYLKLLPTLIQHRSKKNNTITITVKDDYSIDAYGEIID